jgi:hypothetical protein
MSLFLENFEEIDNPEKFVDKLKPTEIEVRKKDGSFVWLENLSYCSF